MKTNIETTPMVSLWKIQDDSFFELAGRVYFLSQGTVYDLTSGEIQHIDAEHKRVFRQVRPVGAVPLESISCGEAFLCDDCLCIKLSGDRVLDIFNQKFVVMVGDKVVYRYTGEVTFK